MPIELEMVLRLLLAAALGAVIGYQRERTGKQAGLRTHVLICLGAALNSSFQSMVSALAAIQQGWPPGWW